MTSADTVVRKYRLRRATQIQTVSVLWVLVEAVATGFAAWSAGSLALTAFSVDSMAELISGIVVLIRVGYERYYGERFANRLERIASAVVALSLFTLAVYIALGAGHSLATRVPPSASTLGVLTALLSSFITPWLAKQKRVLGLQLHSHALIGDAACSQTCAYMAWTLLVGLMAQMVFGWWWIDPLAALCILIFVVREAWESLQSAISGVPHVHSH